LIGRIPGGLAMATVVAATMFKAMSGSTLGTAGHFFYGRYPGNDGV